MSDLDATGGDPAAEADPSADAVARVDRARLLLDRFRERRAGGGPGRA